GIMNTKNHALIDKIIENEIKYQSVKTKSSEHEAKLEELTKLEEEHGNLKALIQAKTEEKDAFGNAQGKYESLRGNLLEARGERTEALQTECEALWETSSHKIRASLSSRGGWQDVQDKFRTLTTGSNLRTHKIETFFDNLVDETSPLETWE